MQKNFFILFIFHTFCILWVFYYLLDEYIQFYKDKFGNRNWNGKIGWNAYIAFGMVWLFNPMLKSSWISYVIIDENKFKRQCRKYLL